MLLSLPIQVVVTDVTVNSKLYKENDIRLSSKKVNVLELPSHLSHHHTLLRGYDAPIRLLALMLSAVFSINI